MLTIELKSLAISNGETLGYREAGHGNKTIVLIHGNNSSSKHWDVLIEKLKKDYRVIAVDLRGFGISSYNKPIFTLKDLADDLFLFVQSLELKDFTIVGWSTGGGIAMEFVINYPGYANNLVLIESVGIKGYPILRKDEQGQPIIGDYLSTKEEIANDPVQVKPLVDANISKNRALLKELWDILVYNVNKPSPEKYEEYIDDILTQRNQVDVFYALSYFNISKDHNGVIDGTGEINKINIPTLIIQGDQDIIIPMEQSKETKDALGDNAKLVVFKNSGHSPLVDSLEELTKEIMDFAG